MYQPNPLPSGKRGNQVEPERGPAPQPVLQAIKLMYAGAAVSTVGLFVSLIVPLADVAGTKAAIKKARPSLTTSQVNQTFTVGIELVVFYGVVGTALWLWMARANSRGRSWTRTLSTVLFGIATLQLFGTLRAPAALGVLFAGLTWLAGGAAVYLLWRKESTDFFKPRQFG